jgi:N-ethylmaleimide reductase
MTSIFDPVTLAGRVLPNRVVMAPMTRNRSPGAVPAPITAAYYAQRAHSQDGAALIVTEGTAISAQGQGYSHVPGIWSDEQVRGWQEVTAAVHARGGRIVCQLWHVGRVSHVSLQPGGAAPVGPSAVIAAARTYLVDESGAAGFVATSMPRALEEQEIHTIIGDYARAARNAMRAGFDGVELHGANGYLIDQFLLDGSNKRCDRWGGSAGNRARFLREVTRAVTAECEGAIVGVRLSPMTPINGAADSRPQQTFECAARVLAPLGLGYVHVVEGQGRGDRAFQSGSRAFDYPALRDAYRSSGGEGLWIVNNGYDSAMANQALAAGAADMVSFGRPFIANPDLTARLREGVELAAADPATYYGGGEAGYTDYPHRTAPAAAIKESA